jgi:hypothetical protein
MKKKLLPGVAVGMLILGSAGVASATDFDFAGTMQSHNDVLIFNFATTAPSTVTLFSSSWIDGNQGFDPMLGLWNNSGNLIYFQDDGGNIGSTVSNGVSYSHGDWDFFYNAVVPGAGTYTVSLTAYDNANKGSNLSDGFAYDSQTPIAFADWNEPDNGIQTGNYEFHVLNADTASGPTPEPASMFLLGTGLAGLVGARKMKKQQSAAKTA